MSKSYLGVFDSGFGGLTVIKSLRQKLKKKNIIYFGDTANVPYGPKSKEEIEQLVIKDIALLKSLGVDTVAFACNTADSVASKAVIKEYPDMTFYGIIKPTCQQAVIQSTNKRIGVIATEAAIRSNAYVEGIKEIDSSIEIFPKACPLLVPLVEQGKVNKNDQETVEALKEYLSYFADKDIDTLILGCTHYPLLTELIIDIMPGIKLISSSACAGEKAAAIIQDEGEAETLYYVSGDPANFTTLAKIFLQSKEDIIAKQLY